MHTRLSILGFLLVLLTAVFPARAEVRVSAQVDRTLVSPGESLQLAVKVKDGSGEVDTSSITDFKVHSRGTSSSVQIINGRMSKEESYNYLLLPLRKGKLTIPALIVDVDGRIHRTKPITISVTEQPPAGAADAPREKSIWVTADLSEISPFAGQQITYTFRLYNAVQVDDAKFQSPEFTGFSAKEIKERRSYRKVINGREHMVTEVYFILTPLEQGPLIIDPALLHVNILRQDRRRRRSAFDDFFNRGVVEPRVLQTEPLTIAVRALPPLPPPQQFSGLVGQFEMTADMETTDLKTGDSATLAIVLQGQGNIMDAQPPKLQLPAAFKRYADNPDEEIRLDRRGTSGKKVFRTALVPVDPGAYTLPPITVVYFDVEKEAYRTLQAQVPPITVTADSTMAETAQVTITPDAIPLLKKKVAFTGRDILPPKESLAAIKSCKPLPWPLFALAIAVPAMAFGCTVLLQRWRRPDTSPSAVMKARALSALKQARSRTGTGQAFLTALYQALTAAIFAAAGRTGEALAWKEAESILQQSGISAATATRAAELLSKIESLKFSGAASKTVPERRLLDQTRKMVRELAK
jgi:hypothetical protein